MIRWRTAVSSAKRTSSWISRLPPSSAGWALPAMTSCTGRSGCNRIALSRSGSRSMRVRRLYDGTRRAKPIVRTSGSSTLSVQASSASVAPRCCQDCLTRLRASVTRPARSSRRTAQIRSSGTRSMPSQPCASSTRSEPTSCSASAKTSGATQVGACTPLVTWVIGTSGESKPGQSPANMPRLTKPCSRETPFARCASRSPITAMLKTVGSPPS
jgi:hypothetical protein